MLDRTLSSISCSSASALLARLSTAEATPCERLRKSRPALSNSRATSRRPAFTLSRTTTRRRRPRFGSAKYIAAMPATNPPIAALATLMMTSRVDWDRPVLSLVVRYRNLHLQQAVFKLGLGLIRLGARWQRDQAVKVSIAALGPVESMLLLLAFLTFLTFDDQPLVGAFQFDVFLLQAGKLGRHFQIPIALAHFYRWGPVPARAGAAHPEPAGKRPVHLLGQPLHHREWTETGEAAFAFFAPQDLFVAFGRSVLNQCSCHNLLLNFILLVTGRAFQSLR